MSESIIDRVQQIVADKLGVDRSDIVAHSNILDDLGADSLDVVELVMAIEEAFELEIPDDAVEGMRTIGDVENYVAKQAAA